MRLRRLLWLVLLTNLLANLLLATIVTAVAVWWYRESRPVAAPPLPEGAQAPLPAKPGPRVSSPEADGREVHERLGIEPQVWERLTRGEVVFTRKGDDRELSLRALFLVQAAPDKLFQLFTDYARMPELYDEVERTAVLERGQDFAVVHYSARYVLFNLTWVVKERFSGDRRTIAWDLVQDPRYPSKLERATGSWRFVPTGIGRMTLLRYQNDFKLSMLPKSLAQRFARQNVPKLAANIRAMLSRTE